MTVIDGKVYNMYELIKPLKETLEKSSLEDMQRWFSSYPKDVPWYVISDYCIGDKGKQNDVVSFSVLLNHDKLENIKSYINASAPKDIKSIRTVPAELLSYINSPVIYHFTFMLPRRDKLLKDYISAEAIKSYLPVLEDYVRAVDIQSTFEDGYLESVIRRIHLFEKDVERNNFNFGLARQVILIGCLASLVYYYLTLLKSPSHIAWVSDKDAIADRYDGFIYDFSVFAFSIEYSTHLIESGYPDATIDKPKFISAIPENYFDELTRIPDYLAGTMADFDLKENKFSKDKYHTIHSNSLIDSQNHSIIQISNEKENISVKRLKFLPSQIESTEGVIRPANDSDCVVYIVDRDDILTLDFAGIMDVISALSNDKNALLQNRGKLEVR